MPAQSYFALSLASCFSVVFSRPTNMSFLVCRDPVMSRFRLFERRLGSAVARVISRRAMHEGPVLAPCEAISCAKTRATSVHFRARDTSDTSGRPFARALERTPRRHRAVGLVGRSGGLVGRLVGSPVWGRPGRPYGTAFRAVLRCRQPCDASSPGEHRLWQRVSRKFPTSCSSHVPNTNPRRPRRAPK